MTDNDIESEMEDIELGGGDDSGPSSRYLIAVWGASIVLIGLYIPLGIFPGIQQIIDTILALIPNITLLQAAVTYLIAKEIYESLQARNVGQLAAGAAGGLANIGGRVDTDVGGLLEDENDEKERLEKIKEEVEALNRAGGLETKELQQFEDLLDHVAGDIENLERDLEDITKDTGDGLTDHIVKIALSAASDGQSQEAILTELEREEQELCNEDGVTERDFLAATENAKSRLNHMSQEIQNAKELSTDAGQNAERMVQMLGHFEHASEDRLNKALEENILEVVSDDEEMVEYEEDLNKIVRTAEKAIQALEDHEVNQRQ